MTAASAIIKRKLERNLTLLKWLSIDESLFASAVVIAFEMHIVGLSLAQVLLGESIFALTILLVDIPTSVFSDIINRKSSFIFAELSLLIGLASFAFAQNFLWIIVAQITWGIGAAALQGTESAMLFDSLKILKREGEHRKMLGRIEGFALLVLASGQIFGGFLGAWNLRFAVILCLIVPITKLFLILFLEEPARKPHPHAHEPFTHLFKTLSWFTTQTTLIFIVFASMTVALGGKVVFQTFNPFMELVNVPIVYWGILLACFNIIGAFVAWKSHEIQKKLGGFGSFAVIFAAEICGLLLMAKLHFIFFAALFPVLFWSILSFRKIFFSDEINRRTESHRRATTLSIESFGTQLLQVCTLGVLGLYADRAGLPALYLLLAASIAGVGIVT
ncbi:MAG: MFS transporter, partial [Candidatus Peregrinibacteria bacterium]